MTVTDARVRRVNPPRSLLQFLPLWLASYFVPLLATWAAVAAPLLAGSITSEEALIVAICLLPVGMVFSQRLLMRRYIIRTWPWALATAVATLLAQLGNTLVAQALESDAYGVPRLIWIYDALGPIFGYALAYWVLTVGPVALIVGASWSIPQGLALPGPRSAKVIWIVAMMLTGVIATTLVASSTTGELRFLAFMLLSSISTDPFWLGVATALLPAFLGWLALASVGGSIMYWTLRRHAPASADVYARFD